MFKPNFSFLDAEADSTETVVQRTVSVDHLDQDQGPQWWVKGGPLTLRL